MSDRASIFGDTDFNVDEFKPKPADKKAPAAEAVRKVAEAAHFPSREPAAPVAAQQGREGRRYRTGRNVQMNVKVTPETLERVYKVADAHEWVLGEVLERAMIALEKELQK